MQQMESRSSPSQANRLGSATDTTTRDGGPLFRRTVHRNNGNHNRVGSSIKTSVGENAPGSLQAMRHFASEASAAASSQSAAATNSSRPRTTGSVQQLVGGTGGGGPRRLSTGSILAATTTQHRRRTPHMISSSSTAGSDTAATSVRVTQQQQRQNQQQHYRTHLTRNLSVGNIRSTAPVGQGGGGGDGDDNFGDSAELGVGDWGGEGMGLLIRRGWQAGGTGGSLGSRSTHSIGGMSGAVSRVGLGDIDGRPSIANASRALRGMLSRLPMLEASGKHEGLYDQSPSIENADLLEHGMSFGVSALKGRRPYMEDEYKVIPRLELTEGSGEAMREVAARAESTHFFGLFDGHAGGRCSKALTQILAQTVSREADFSLELTSAVHKGFLRANAEFLRKAERFCANDGSTAITAFIRGGRIVVGNVGDSRAVLCSDGRAAPLSSDHKPNKPEERRRIQALGGRVVYSFGIPRVNGILAVSRAFGDRNMKGAINAEPDVRERLLERGDDYLVLATDGLWDVMTSQEACNIVYSCAPDLGPQACSELLTATALRKGSMDNTSAMVVDLRGLWDATEGSSHATARNSSSAGCRRQLNISTSSSSVLVPWDTSRGDGGERGRQSCATAWTSQASRNNRRDTSPGNRGRVISSSGIGGGSSGALTGGGGGGSGLVGPDQQQRRQQQQQRQQLRQFTRRRSARQQHQQQHAGAGTAQDGTVAASPRESARIGRLSPGPPGEGLWAKAAAAANPSSSAWGRSISPGSAWSNTIGGAVAAGRGSGGGSRIAGHFSSPQHQQHHQQQHPVSSTESAMSLYGGGGGNYSRNQLQSTSRRN